MPLPRHEVDVVVIGAGAAGLAAARRLAGHPLSLLVLEAGSRLGGRAWTLQAGFALDLGCGWLHSADRNPWVPIARGQGLTIDRTPPPWSTQAFDLGFSAAEQHAYRAAAAAFRERIEKAAQGPRDRAAAELLEPGGRWNALLNAAGSYVNGVEYDRLSVRDFASYHETGVNWRVREGYGAAIRGCGAGLPVALRTPATAISHAGPRLRIATPGGDIAAKAVIVTVSTGVLSAGSLRISPPLPDKIEAAAGLPLGSAAKIFFTLDRPDDLPKDSQLFGATDRTGAGCYHLRPFGRPVIEGYFGGRLAQDLERAGEDALAAFAIDELASLLGAGIRGRLKRIAASRWGLEPHIGGAYSYALPGSAGCRAILAQPVNGKLFFAGEACARSAFSTAHGAYETGLAAAEQVLAAL